MTIGNNTNNKAGAHYLVIKDVILQSVQEYNMNAFFEKFTEDFNKHFKTNFCQFLADLKMVYKVLKSSFCWQKEKKKNEIGCVKPYVLQMKSWLYVFSVRSATKDLAYIVDLIVGGCGNTVG